MNQLLESFATLIKLFAEPLVCSCLLFLTVAQALLWIAFARHSDRTHERLRTLEQADALADSDDAVNACCRSVARYDSPAVVAARAFRDRQEELAPAERAIIAEMLGE